MFEQRARMSRGGPGEGKSIRGWKDKVQCEDSTQQEAGRAKGASEVGRADGAGLEGHHKDCHLYLTNTK